MCQSTGALQVLHLGTCYSLRGYPGRRKLYAPGWLLVNAVAVTPDGKRAVSASQDGTLKVWELESGRELRTLTGHSDRVRAVAVTPERQRAVSASDDETLKVWELNTGEVFATFSYDGHALCCAFHDDKRIISGDAVGRVHFLTLEEPKRKN